MEKQLELQQTKETLDELAKSKEKAIMSPIGAGSFALTQLTDTKNVIIALGSDVACKKPIPEAKKILDSRYKEMDKVIKDVDKELLVLARQMENLALQIEETEKGQ